MQFFHPLIRSIQKASYSGIVCKEDRLQRAQMDPGDRKVMQGGARSKSPSVCDLFPRSEQRLMGWSSIRRITGLKLGQQTWGTKKGRQQRHRAIETFFLKFSHEHVCKMTDESNFVHSLTRGLACSVCNGNTRHCARGKNFAEEKERKETDDTSCQ